MKKKTALTFTTERQMTYMYDALHGKEHPQAGNIEYLKKSSRSKFLNKQAWLDWEETKESALHVQWFPHCKAPYLQCLVLLSQLSQSRLGFCQLFLCSLQSML